MRQLSLAVEAKNQQLRLHLRRDGSLVGSAKTRPPTRATHERDVLLSVDGTPVNSLADLTAAVNAAAPHHSAQFEMSRDGVARDVTIPL